MVAHNMRAIEKILMVLEFLVLTVLGPSHISAVSQDTDLHSFLKLPCLAKQVEVGFLWLPCKEP